MLKDYVKSFIDRYLHEDRLIRFQLRHVEDDNDGQVVVEVLN